MTQTMTIWKMKNGTYHWREIIAGIICLHVFPTIEKAEVYAQANNLKIEIK